jgi:hypothetical protein
MTDSTREAATISHVFFGKEPDRGFRCAIITCEMECGTQGFVCGAGKFLTKLRQAMLHTFDVANEEDLVGKKCYVLRSFPGWNESIVGLEAPSGKRFLSYVWARSVGSTTETILESRKESLRSSIKCHEDAVRRNKKELANLNENFVDWEHRK